MAVDLGQLAVELRLSTDPDTPPDEPLASVLSRALRAAQAVVDERVRDDAPEAIKDMAVVAVASYLFDKSECGPRSPVFECLGEQRGRSDAVPVDRPPGRGDRGGLTVWPFSKPEPETRASYTEAAIKAIVEGAGGSTPADYRETAAAQAAASLVARSLAIAEIEGATPARTGLTGAMLHDLGAALILEGEAVYRIDVATGGTVTLSRAFDWDITGGPDPQSWRYRIKIAGPTRDAETILPSVAIFHPRVNASPSEPHKGRSPIGLAAQSARMAAGIESASLETKPSNPVGLSPARILARHVGDTTAEQR